VSQPVHSHTCYAFVCRSEFSLGGTHGAMLYGFAALLGRTRGSGRPSFVTQTFRPFCVARFSLSSSCSYYEAPSSYRSSSSLVHTRPLSGPKPRRPLALRVQAMAHGQAVRECRKLKPLFRVRDITGHHDAREGLTHCAHAISSACTDWTSNVENYRPNCLIPGRLRAKQVQT
jgi:hypothetical protein